LGKKLRGWVIIAITSTFTGTINKLEEMMPTGATISYSSTTITTELRQSKGIVSTISTRLDTPTSETPSPGWYPHTVTIL